VATVVVIELEVDTEEVVVVVCVMIVVREVVVVFINTGDVANSIYPLVTALRAISVPAEDAHHRESGSSAQ
jgi:hypothetical protein